MSPRADILLGLAGLRDCVSALKVKPSLQSSATLLHSLLTIFFDQMKAHAAKQLDGLARMVYQEVSGHAGLRVIRRIDTACMQYEKAAASAKEARFARSGGSGGWPRGKGSNKPRPKKDYSNTKCYNCFAIGHMKCKNVNQ